MAKIEKNLQALILELPQKEKDKLLLRLVAKDDLLVKKFQFELLEAGDTIQERRDGILNAIEQLYRIEGYSAGYLMMDMRAVSGAITEHFKVTKDKYGEIELTLELLVQCFEKQLRWIERYNSKTDTLANYVAKRTDSIYKKLIKLHPDIQFDFYEKMNQLLNFVHTYAPSFYAKQLGIPKTFEVVEL